jgi:hypothetical protein
MSCRIDSWVQNGGTAWFQCQRGTVGCPVIHDGFTPHCIQCAAGGPCKWHAEPALEMTEEEYRKLEAARA